MPAIVVDSVSKRFRRFAKDRPYTFQEALVKGFRTLRAQDTFWALKDVSLEVGVGEMLGVIGRNGAGKTSLLRLIGGIGRPDEGHIWTDGRLGALIDLGAGYHPELTGRENVMMNAVIAGVQRRDVSAILQDIIEFAELEAFIDSPLRTYSTGMQLRLAFSVVIHLRPEILLIDEVLAVGDLGFQQKCLNRIQQLRRAGTAILFVTHDLHQAQQFCDRVAWLEKGQVAAYGSAAEVVAAYQDSTRLLVQQGTSNNNSDSRVPGGETLRINENRFGSLDLILQQVQILDDTGKPTRIIPAGKGMQVEMEWQVIKPVGDVIFGVGIHSLDGTVVSEIYTTAGSLPAQHGKLRLLFGRLDLAPGSYFIDVGVYPANWSRSYDYHWHVYSLSVEGESVGKGPMRPPHQWMIEGLG